MSGGPLLHRQTSRIRLYDTDAAGRLFYAHQFRLAHDACEELFARLGFSVGDQLSRGRFILPVVHASADYKRPLRVGQEVVVEIRLQRLGRSSLTLLYRLVAGGETAGHVTTVHVAVNPATGKPMALPARLRKALRKPRA